jgi:hypothetical protein
LHGNNFYAKRLFLGNDFFRYYVEMIAYAVSFPHLKIKVSVSSYCLKQLAASLGYHSMRIIVNARSYYSEIIVHTRRSEMEMIFFGQELSLY